MNRDPRPRRRPRARNRNRTVENRLRGRGGVRSVRRDACPLELGRLHPVSRSETPMVAVGFSLASAHGEPKVASPVAGATFESAPAAQLIIRASLRDARPLPQAIRGLKPDKTHGYHHVVASETRAGGRMTTIRRPNW